MAGVMAILALLLALASCHKSHDTRKPGLEEAKAKRDLYVSELAKSHQLMDIIPDCDFTTFASLLSAFADLDTGVERSEAAPGKWVRNPDETKCWPEGSRSETSLDVYLGVAHWILSLRRAYDLERIIALGEGTSWIMGQGPLEYTNIAVLAPLLYSMRDGIALHGEGAWLSDASTHREHIAAMLSYLHGRISGQVTSAELAIMASFAAAYPENPIFQALYHRYLDGDQSRAVDIVTSMPDWIDTEVGAYGWGSAPGYLFPIVAVAIMEGQ